MNFASSQLRRLSRLGTVTLTGLAISATLAPGATGFGPDTRSHAPAGGIPPAGSEANRVTMRNGSARSVDVMLHITWQGDISTCRALSLAIRDRATGPIVKSAPATLGSVIRVARLLPRQTAQYEAEIRFVPRNDGVGTASPAGSRDTGCAIGFAWSFAPTR